MSNAYERELKEQVDLICQLQAERDIYLEALEERRVSGHENDCIMMICMTPSKHKCNCRYGWITEALEAGRKIREGEI